MYDNHNDIYSICYCAVCFMFIQTLLPHLPCIFQQFTLCYCLVTSLLRCALWKSVYISCHLSHFLEVHLLHRKILEMPLFTFVGVILAVHSKSRGFCVLWGFMALFGGRYFLFLTYFLTSFLFLLLPLGQILPFLFVFFFVKVCFYFRFLLL